MLLQKQEVIYPLLYDKHECGFVGIYFVIIGLAGNFQLLKYKYIFLKSEVTLTIIYVRHLETLCYVSGRVKCSGLIYFLMQISTHETAILSLYLSGCSPFELLKIVDPEDGYCSVCRNVVTHLTADVANPRNLKLVNVI
jgi:hypothetical protein